MYLQRCIATGLLAIAVAGPPVASAAYPVASAFLIYPGDVLSPRHEARAGTAMPDLPAATAADTATSAGTSEPGGFGQPVSPETLDATRGGDGGIASDTRLDGTVSGNSATHVITGGNVIQSGSFANTTGVPIVIQNSGANVLIQNATVINLQVK